MPSRDAVPGLAARLITAREAAGLSVQAAADRSGVHFVSITRFEKDRRVPTIATLCKLAEAYGVRPGDLLPPSAAAPAGGVGPVTTGTSTGGRTATG